MRLPGRRRRFGALVSPAGVTLVELRTRAGGLRIAHTGRDDRSVEGAAEAAERLVRLIERSGARAASVAVAVNGFGACYQRLTLPPTDAEEVLRPVVTRELRRLYPDLRDPVVDFEVRPGSDEADDGPNDVPAAALPRATVHAFLDAVDGTSTRIDRITVPPVAIERFLRETGAAGEATAALLVPDGIPMLGFAHEGELRLYREPQQAALTGRGDEGGGDALVQGVVGEVKRGRTYMRHKYDDAQVGRLLVAAETSVQAGMERALDALPALAVERLDAGGLSPGGLIALHTALLDVSGPAMDLVPREERGVGGSDRAVRALAVASAAVVVLAAVEWAVSAVRAGTAARERAEAVEARVEARLPSVLRMRPVVEARRAHEERVAYRGAVAEERATVQRLLVAMARAAPEAVVLDSLEVRRTGSGWRAAVGGAAIGRSSAEAARAVDALYRSIPRRAPVRDQTLWRLEAVETGSALDTTAIEDAVAATAVALAFEMSFIVETGPWDGAR